MELESGKIITRSLLRPTMHLLGFHRYCYMHACLLVFLNACSILTEAEFLVFDYSLKESFITTVMNIVERK